ncbi:MAG: MogA/MoaB family molybdenum cofactor biosynthesis protein [Candidatus Brockarchaeota archaeon]|nr:MogA/MoaB family molybdenum cofactor biosynthesis protein [Candidatus Brockarchaeota archaeon]
MSFKQHKESAAGIKARVAVLIVSDFRTPETDESGDLASNILEEIGHFVKERRYVNNAEEEIMKEIRSILRRDDIDVIVAIGGTGISSKDLTADVVSKLLEKKINGFGELFRFLSYEEIGSAAMMSRACAGIANRKIIFSIPGSPDAVRLAVQRLIGPELSHIIFEISR